MIPTISDCTYFSPSLIAFPCDIPSNIGTLSHFTKTSITESVHAGVVRFSLSGVLSTTISL